MTNNKLSDVDIDYIVNSILSEGLIKNHNIKVQKYYRLERFIDALDNNYFTFQVPRNWEDPFEDFISQLTNNDASAEIISMDLVKNVHAMSVISRKNECDGMWRNYAGYSGVMISMTLKSMVSMIVRFLYSSCLNHPDLFQSDTQIKKTITGHFNIRKVKYSTDKKIADLFRDATNEIPYDILKVTYELLAVKRHEFEYENEYRLLLNKNALKLKSNICSGNFSCKKLLNVDVFRECIDEVVIFPFPEKEAYNNIGAENKIREACKKHNLKCRKSELYNIDVFKERYNL